jgi:aryl-alcohol dehydrogenase-like predicted oxidoreductase
VPVGWQLVEELKGDEELRKALSEELLAEALSRKEWRKSVLLAVSREVATRGDIRELREYIDASVRGLRAYVDSRFDRLNSRIDVLLVTVAVTLATTLIPLILRVLSGV